MERGALVEPDERRRDRRPDADAGQLPSSGARPGEIESKGKTTGGTSSEFKRLEKGGHW
jgi:hypothetical protein